MSKRFAFNPQYGERKKAKLDISISDHHFPLSQNPSSSNKENDLDTWGDDNDDEILLQASQVCEQAFSNDTSFLPDYNAWKQPSSTSTQYQAPTTSKAPFVFKKPIANPPSTFSTHTISSPLPGIATKCIPEPKRQANMTDDLVINANMVSGQDDYIYKQWLQLKEENEKLKADNDKLLEKCVTKEGEASILRTQLKSCQQAVDNARIEKTRAQENVKMEYTEKLAAVNSQVADLQTQLEFKKLEIISVKEKCKKVESGKIRLSQVTIQNNDISLSYKNNNMYGLSQQAKRVQTSSSSVQTDKLNPFIKLNKTQTKDVSNITKYLAQVLEPTQPQLSILDYNENLQKQIDIPLNKRTFHRIPSTPIPKQKNQDKVADISIYNVMADLVKDPNEFGKSKDKCIHLFSIVKATLDELQRDLEEVSRRVTAAFVREMDERNIEAGKTFFSINIRQLLGGREIYKEEQGIRARRMLAILSVSLETPAILECFEMCHENTAPSIMDTALRICELIDDCSSGVLYTGYIVAVCTLLHSISRRNPDTPVKVTAIANVARGPAVAAALSLVRILPPVSHTGAQESCQINILMKHIERALKCIERQRLETEAISFMENLTALYGNMNGTFKADPDENRCQCQVSLAQALAYCLSICTDMLNSKSNQEGSVSSSILSGACRSGVRALHAGAAASARLPPIALALRGDALYVNMMAELTSTFQTAPEDAPPAYHHQPWMKSFENFTVAD